MDLEDIGNIPVSTKAVASLYHALEARNQKKESNLETDGNIIRIKKWKKANSIESLTKNDTYWNIGRWIVLEEQKGELRAEYGTQLLKKLAVELTKEIGKDFTERNLRNYHLFYIQFSDYEIWHACVPDLT